MSRMLVDFHHSSLLRSFYLLFEDRLGIEVFRPIGMEWYGQKYWDVFPSIDTARQYLDLDQAYKPSDGTPALNKFLESTNPPEGVFYCGDPGMVEINRACTLDYFKENDFDFVLCSIPQHIKPFQELIRKYKPKAKLIVQIGNEWPPYLFRGMNVLASVAPRNFGWDTNAFFYHQEFDTNIFKPSGIHPGLPNVHSYINVLQNMQMGWEDFQHLERLLEPKGFMFRSYGGQCRDGNQDGPHNLAHSIETSMFVFHVKDGGDGFGHIIHNAFAMGRPVITRSRFYRDRLAADLLIPGAFIDLDGKAAWTAAHELEDIANNPAQLEAMSTLAANRFREVVNYENEARGIQAWLTNLR